MTLCHSFSSIKIPNTRIFIYLYCLSFNNLHSLIHTFKTSRWSSSLLVAFCEAELKNLTFSSPISSILRYELWTLLHFLTSLIIFAVVCYYSRFVIDFLLVYSSSNFIHCSRYVVIVFFSFLLQAYETSYWSSSLLVAFLWFLSLCYFFYFIDFMTCTLSHVCFIYYLNF